MHIDDWMKTKGIPVGPEIEVIRELILRERIARIWKRKD